MTFKKGNRNSNQGNSEAIGRVSLWFAEDKNYVASGIVDIEGKSYRVYLYEPKEGSERKPNSSDIYGYVFEKEEQQQRPPQREQRQQRSPQNRPEQWQDGDGQDDLGRIPF